MTPFKNSSRPLFFLFGLIVLSGCGHHIPATNPLNQNQLETALPLLKDQLILQTKNCSKSWDANLEVELQATGKNQKFSGYLKIQEPSSIKFIASNPFGQPLVALTTNGEYFRFLDVINRQFSHGRTLSYALYSDIAPQFVSGQWGNWLAARLPDFGENGFELFETSEIQGFWIKQHSTKNTTHFYLWDAQQKRIKQYLLLDDNERLLAKFDYSNYIDIGQCQQPKTISITELPFGSKIQIHLDRIQTTIPMNKKDLLLKPPSHYTIKIIP